MTPTATVVPQFLSHCPPPWVDSGQGGALPFTSTHPHCHLLDAYCAPGSWHRPVICATSCRVLQFALVLPKRWASPWRWGRDYSSRWAPGGRGAGGGWSPGVAFGLWAADCLREPAPSPPRAAAPPSTSWARSFPESRFGSSFLWVDGGGSRWGEFRFAPPGVHWPLILGVLVTRKDKPVVASVRGLSTGSLLLSRQLSRTQHWR